MKSKFLGYFKLSDDQVKEIWTNGVFVFDANTLLNMYRYSDTTRDELFSQFESIKQRVWLPHQAGVEFFRNRISVIADQKKTYDDMKRDLTSIKRQFSTDRGHPFISAESASKLEETITKIEQELDASGQTIEQRMTKDDVLDRLAKIFNERTGDEFDEEAMKALFVEGEDRYNRKVPPGYMDAGKVKDPQTSDDKQRLYGDLILWRQTLEMAKAEEKHVVFVTDDRKEDWWLEKNGKTISPRPELIAEFNEVTGKLVKFYTPDSFVVVAGDYVGAKISEGVIDEVRAAETAKQTNALAEFRSKSGNFNALAEVSNSSWKTRRMNALRHPLHHSDDNFSSLRLAKNLEKLRRYADRASNEELQKTASRLSQFASSDEYIELLRQLEIIEEANERAGRLIDQPSDHSRNELMLEYVEACRRAELSERKVKEILEQLSNREDE